MTYTYNIDEVKFREVNARQLHDEIDERLTGLIGATVNSVIRVDFTTEIDKSILDDIVINHVPTHNTKQHREEIIQQLIDNGKDNDMVDDNGINGLFDKYHSEILRYERTGMDGITPALQNEIDTNGEYKDFLESWTDEEQQINVFTAITKSLI